MVSYFRTIASRTAFSRRLTCFIPLVFVDLHQSTVPWLSLYIGVGTSLSLRPSLLHQSRTERESLAYYFVALTSDSHKLRLVRLIWNDFQETGPPKRNTMKPAIYRSLKNSIPSPSGTAFPSWDPQHASQYDVSLWCSCAWGGVHRSMLRYRE